LYYSFLSDLRGFANDQTKNDKAYLVDHLVKSWLFDQCFTTPISVQENTQLSALLTHMKTYWKNQGDAKNQGLSLLNIRLADLNVQMKKDKLCQGLPKKLSDEKIVYYYFCISNKPYMCGYNNDRAIDRSSFFLPCDCSNEPFAYVDGDDININEKQCNAE